MDADSPSVNTGAMLCGVVVHWHDEAGVETLAAAWPDDPRFDLLVIDNGSTTDLRCGPHRILKPGRNLGFGGAVNLALQQTRAAIVLILNSDARPEPGALESLLQGFARHAEAAGLAPRLVAPTGESQHGWQLRPLPSAWQLALQALMLPVWSGPDSEPAAGTVIEQPAAAALALRRARLMNIGGFDATFYPAWFEDVDLAARLRVAGDRILYWPEAQFVHRLGSSVDRLGYGRFLWIHYRNLVAYLRKHHGAIWATIARALLVPASLVRTMLLPFRKPKRAASRTEAASGLATLTIGALTNWRRPAAVVSALETEPEPRPTR